MITKPAQRWVLFRSFHEIVEAPGGVTCDSECEAGWSTPFQRWKRTSTTKH